MEVFIPTRDNIILQEWKQLFTHFSERLRQRYGLNITYEEYLLLCRTDRIVLRKLSKNKQIVMVKFKGTYVFAIKRKPKNALVTALHPIHAAKRLKY